MDAEKRKEQILDCSKKLFSKHGYYNTQISDIIDKAGIARGTLYQYFKNKDDIFLTLMENFFKEWKKNISLSVNSQDSSVSTPQEYLLQKIKSTLLFFARDQAMSNIVLRMGIGLGGDFESKIDKFEKKIQEMIKDDIRLGIKLNFIDKSLDVEVAANLIGGGMLRTAYYYFIVKKQHKNPEIIDKISSEIVKILNNGIFL